MSIDYEDLRKTAEAQGQGWYTLERLQDSLRADLAKYVYAFSPAVVLELLNAVIHSGEQAADLRTALAIAREALMNIADNCDCDRHGTTAGEALTSIIKLLCEREA